MSKKTNPERKEHTLKKHHVHQGKAMEPGGKVSLRADQAQRLKRRQVI